MAKNNQDLIEQLIKQQVFFSIHAIPDIARAPGAIRADFLVMPLPHIIAPGRVIKTYLDVMMFNDFWLSRMLSTEGVFNEVDDTAAYWLHYDSIETSIVGHMVRHKPNEFLNKIVSLVPDITSFLDRSISSRQDSSVFDCLVKQEQGRLLNLNLLNNVFNKIIEKEGAFLTQKRFTQFVQALTNTSEHDLLRTMNMTGIRAALLSKEGSQNPPVFTHVSTAKTAISDNYNFNLNFVTALLEQNIDMQIAGAFDWFCLLPPAVKQKAIHVLNDKLESIRQIAELQLNSAQAPGQRNDYSLLNACVCVLNNHSAITSSQLNDDINSAFLHQLTSVANQLIEQGMTDAEADNLYIGRTDKGALYVKAMIVHHKTKSIFDSIMLDDVCHENSANLDR